MFHGTQISNSDVHVQEFVAEAAGLSVSPTEY